MFKFFILAVAVTLITIALCFNSVLFRETNELIRTINSGSPVSSLQPRRLETESANHGNIEASVRQSAINGQLGHRRDRLASSDGSFERKRTHDQSRSDAKSSSLLKRLKHLKKQLTQALRAPIAGVPVATSPALARGITALAAAALNTRAPADDASAGPWEFPGEPGLYSSLKRSLGQVRGPSHFPRCEHIFRALSRFVRRRPKDAMQLFRHCEPAPSARGKRSTMRLRSAPGYRALLRLTTDSLLCARSRALARVCSALPFACARSPHRRVRARPRARSTSDHALRHTRVVQRAHTRAHAHAHTSCRAIGCLGREPGGRIPSAGRRKPLASDHAPGGLRRRPLQRRAGGTLPGRRRGAGPLRRSL